MVREILTYALSEFLFPLCGKLSVGSFDDLLDSCQCVSSSRLPQKSSGADSCCATFLRSLHLLRYSDSILASGLLGYGFGNTTNLSSHRFLNRQVLDLKHVTNSILVDTFNGNVSDSWIMLPGIEFFGVCILEEFRLSHGKLNEPKNGLRRLRVC
jgi:hypothetical protein